METFRRYRTVEDDLPTTSLEWPLYGAGLGKLGIEEKPVERGMPQNGPDELLIRHDAIGLCFTDVKEISYGAQHPRLVGRDLAKDPIVPGHETCMTVIRVGEKLQDQYQTGERFAIQPDVWYKGKSIPYCFGMDGAYRQYGVIGKEVLYGDEGNYLIPIPTDMSYAGAALTEPWGCVEASYRMAYRRRLKPEGNVWIFGNSHSRRGYKIDEIWNSEHKPGLVVLTDVPDNLEDRLCGLGRSDDVTILKQSQDEVINSQILFHDVFVLDGIPEQVNQASELMANQGILAMTGEGPMSGPIRMDFGRVHYDSLLYVGTTSLDLDSAYRQNPDHCNLKPGGTTLIMGAAGPMGRMHLQRAIESSENPAMVMATDIENSRLGHLRTSFAPLAQEQKVELILTNPMDDLKSYESVLDLVVRQGGFNDVQVMVTSLEAIAQVVKNVAARGVINLFAGLKRGTIAEVDAFLIYGPKQLRYVGHSGLKLADQVAIVEKYQNGELQPHRSVAAICGMRQISDGIRAMQNAVYPGKIVVYPSVNDFPLTGLPELKAVLPNVYQALQDGSVWTNKAEELFLEQLLK